MDNDCTGSLTICDPSSSNDHRYICNHSTCILSLRTHLYYTPTFVAPYHIHCILLIHHTHCSIPITTLVYSLFFFCHAITSLYDDVFERGLILQGDGDCRKKVFRCEVASGPDNLREAIVPKACSLLTAVRAREKR